MRMQEKKMLGKYINAHEIAHNRKTGSPAESARSVSVSTCPKPQIQTLGTRDPSFRGAYVNNTR